MPALVFIASSQAEVASAPLSSRMALTMAWKSAPLGDAAHLPCQAGSCRSMIEAGRSDSGSRSVLYTKTVERAAIPTQLPVDGLFAVGTCASVEASTGANSPAC